MTLKIQKSNEDELVVFTLAGRIQGEQLPELLALLSSGPPLHNVLVDLKYVKLVDRDAVQFLAQCEAGGAGIRNCSAYIREWITQEKSAIDRNQPGGPQGLAAKENTLCG
jgi:hypothetical protein